MKQYSFLFNESMCCAAGLTAYESPATNSGTFEDTYCKKQKKSKKKIKKQKLFKTEFPK
jgi:hypothetical protein